MPDGAAFWLPAGVAVVAALGAVSARTPFGSALALSLCLVALAGLHAALGSWLLSAVQILVGAGSGAVLALFAIALVVTPDRARGGDRQPRAKLLALAALAALVVQGVALTGGGGSTWALPSSDFGSAGRIGELLMTDYLLAFHLTGGLMLAGVVAAVVMGKRRLG